MNWYKTARRNPYEILANKFAKEFFSWFIKQPFAKHYTTNKTNDAIDVLDIPLTKNDLETLGINEYFEDNPLEIRFIISDFNPPSNPQNKSFTMSGRARSKPLVALIAPHLLLDTDFIPPVIIIRINLYKMNKSKWNEVKQALHTYLRHEFEHLYQYLTAIKQEDHLLQSVFTPPNQIPNELYNMKQQIANIQKKIITIGDQIEQTTLPQMQNQILIHCLSTMNNPEKNLEKCEEAKINLTYYTGLLNFITDIIQWIPNFVNFQEIEALAVDMYYTAKAKNTKIEDELEKWFEPFFTNKKYPHPELDWLLYDAKNILIHWVLRWIEHRYPEYSKYRNQQPV